MDSATFCALGAPGSPVTNAVAASRVEAEWMLDFDQMGPTLTVFASALMQIAVNAGAANVTVRTSLIEGDTAGAVLVSIPAPGSGTGGVILGQTAIAQVTNPGGKRYVTFTSSAATGPTSLSFRGLFAVVTAAEAGCASSVNTPLVALNLGARVLADKVNDASISSDTWNQWVNQGIESLWSKVVAALADSFFATAPFTLAGGVGGNSFDVTTIPAGDFRHVKLVEWQPNTVNRTRLKAFNFAEKDRGAALARTAGVVWDQRRRYRLMGNQLFVEPYEVSQGSYLLYYTPKTPTLALKCDALPDVLQPYAEYPMLFAAIKGLGQEESDPGVLQQRMADILADIVTLAPSRDDNESDVIADVEEDGDDRGGFW